MPHVAALFRVFVVGAKFLFYMRSIRLYVLLMISGLLWLAAITLCRPFKSRRSNQLAVVSGACWILITGIGELFSEDVVTGRKKDYILLAIISSLAAFIPAMLFLVTYRLGEPVRSVVGTESDLMEMDADS